jgi:hypothetical protein
MRQRVRLLQERCVLDVARDIAKIFDMPESKIVHVKDRAFNDQCALMPCSPSCNTKATGIERHSRAPRVSQEDPCNESWSVNDTHLLYLLSLIE